MQKFETLRQPLMWLFLKFTHCPGYFGGHAKFQIPTICPYWGLATAARKEEEIPLAPMGVLAPGSAHARPSARPPIDTSGNFPAHVSAESHSNISPNPSEVIHFCRSNKNLKKPKNHPPRGPGGGGPNFFFYPNFYLY